MICTRIRIMPLTPKTFNNYDEYMDWALESLGSDKEAFVQAREIWFGKIRESIHSGYIKNLTVMEWEQDSNSAVNEFFSDDMLLARQFLKQLRELPESMTILNTYQKNGLAISIETEPKTVIPYVDSKRIFDEDITVSI